MKRMLRTLLALCLLPGLTPAALGAEPAGETFQYTLSQDGGGYDVAAEAPVKADDYTITQDTDGYTVTGAYEDGSTYVLVNKEPSFQVTIYALINDIRGDGATIKLGGDLTIAGDTEGLPDGSYPTTGVRYGWITWDLQQHTLHLDNLCMAAQADGVLTVKNGAVAFAGGEIDPGGALFGAQNNGRMVAENVAATRDDGGCLLGAYDVYWGDGGQAMATDCTLSNGSGFAQTKKTSGTNAIYAGANSTVRLVRSTVTSAAHWAGANVTGGTLEADAGSTITAAAGCTAAGAENGTISLQGATLSGTPALRDWGGGFFSLSGNAKADTIEIAGPGVVDAAGYTGGGVTLTYTGGDMLADVPLVTGCDSEATAKKFTMAEGGAVNLAYEEQSDGTWAAVAAATPLTEAVTAFTEGTAYSVSSKTELERLAALVNSGNSGKGCLFVLTGDVDLEGSEEHQWPSIGRKDGKENAPFTGVFDGGGHTVSGLYIRETDPSAMYGDKGLFAYVSPNGGVRNLTVVGQAGGGSYVGGVVSHNRGRVENCVSRVNVRGYSSLGGVISTNVGGAIVNCTNYGTVTGEGDAGGVVCDNIGGATVTGCVNHGAVSGTTRVGGVVASNEKNSTTAGCVNHGPVTGGPGSTGGVAGNNEGTVTDCVNNGAVLATLSVGGIAGGGMPGSTIAGCQNNGAVTVHPETTSGEECGGVLGYSNGATVENCVNRGAVTAQTAGIAGWIGGVVGAAGSGEINTCYNIGAVSCLGKEVGGIVGYTNSTAVTGCVSLGLSVKGSEQAGRIAGSAGDSSILSGNFARSDLSLTGGSLTETTAKQDGVDGESVTLSGDWQNTAFAGWDFETVWNEGEGDSLPTLKGSEDGITVPRRASGGGSSSSKPSVTAGEGGTVRADNKGSVTITPDKGWRIASVTVNGKAVEIPKDGVLTGLKSSDKVAVAFEQTPPEPVLTPNQFTDLDTDAWYYDAVSYVLKNGLFRGTSENTFSPAAPMSRGMIFTVLHRISGEDGEAADGDTWYAPALAWAVEHGISDGSNPDGEITREQLAAMLYRYAKTLPGDPPEESGAAASFSDYNAVSSYAEEAVQWAAGHGILTGKGNGILDPAGTATRAETAVMLQRFIGRNAR